MLMKEKRRLSIKPRLELLADIVAFPANYVKDEALCKALVSQTAFAKYSQAEFLEMSLNSLKRLSNEEIEDGFSGLDRMRIKALKKLKHYKEKKQKIDKPYTKSDLVKKLTRARDENKKLQGELVVSAMCLMQLLQSFEALTDQLEDKNIKRRFRKERHEILSLFYFGVDHEVALAKFSNVVRLRDVT